MEIYISWNICRICLQEEQNGSVKMKGLFVEYKNLLLHIYEFSGVSMKPNDSLPDKICHKCVSVINSAIEFRKICRSSDVFLQSILDRAKSANSLPKPERFQCQLIDDSLKLDDMESPTSVASKKGYQHGNFEKTNDKTKELALSESGKKTSILDYQENEVEQEHPGYISEYVLELEEIADPSEELDDELFCQKIEDDTNEEFMVKDDIEHSNLRNAKSSQLEKFYMSTRFSKDTNIEEKESNFGNDRYIEEYKQEQKEGDDENSNANYIFGDVQDLVSGDHVEIDIIDDEDIKSEDDVDVNHAQVSSTVDANDVIEYYESKSNISNTTSDLDEDRLKDENFSKCYISKTKSSKGTYKINLEQSKMMKKSPDKRKSRLVKSSAYLKRKKSVCEICGNQYENRNLMNIHMKIHFQFKNHQCELCFKSFITACNLQAHMRIHTGERPFECKYCGRRFNDRTSHIRHERTHTNEKPFTCPSCGKSFKLSTTLQNHMKVHTNERSYRCEPCGKSFKLSHHLKTHQGTILHKYALEAAAS